MDLYLKHINAHTHTPTTPQQTYVEHYIQFDNKLYSNPTSTFWHCTHTFRGYEEQTNVTRNVIEIDRERGREKKQISRKLSLTLHQRSMETILAGKHKHTKLNE